MRIAGVDGCKSGWVVAWEGTPVEVEVFRSFEAVINRNPNRNADRSPDLKPKLLVVDIPIGLAERGVREADRLARACLKGRACCVFNAPLRGMLRCADYDAACAHGEQVEGKRISRQT